MGIRDRPVAPRSPWQNRYVERVIGSIRRDLLDHVIILNAGHLRKLLRRYADYYNAIEPISDWQKTHPTFDQFTRSAKSCHSQSWADCTMPIWDGISGRDNYVAYRTHLGLAKDTPLRRAVQRAGQIAEMPQLGGLHHAYVGV